MEWVGKVEEVRSITRLEKWVWLKVKGRFAELSVTEEQIWKQRAKAKWEIQGDRNTRYFHSIATTKKRRNEIDTVEYEGRLHTTQMGKAEAFRDLYIKLMGTESQKLPVINWSQLYGEETNLQGLAQDITEDEIAAVINSWPSNKSPGPDGFTGEFYKEFRDILLPDLHKTIKEILDKGLEMENLNTSYIVLIPKKEDAKRPQDFRPISLIHGIQRIISKVLAIRLQPHIQPLVKDSQTGFTKGRQITEGFLYAQQILHITKEKKIPLALFKADIHKAFDTLSWEFLMKVMQGLSFPEKWLQWISNNVLRGSSQIILNGLLGRKIHLKRGVRQGDPLSPLLFILAMDFLTRWLDKLVANGTWQLPFQNMRPCLLYADDTLFFIKPETRQIQALKIVLLAFKEISGLSVNMDKSEMLFATEQEQRYDHLVNLLGCKKGTFPFTYLGLPLSNKKLPRSAYMPLIQKVNNRLQGWATNHLSIAGRLILINAVLSSIPTYFMSVFKLPAWVINEIDKTRRKFLWKKNAEGTGGMHLAN